MNNLHSYLMRQTVFFVLFFFKPSGHYLTHIADSPAELSLLSGFGRCHAGCLYSTMSREGRMHC